MNLGSDAFLDQVTYTNGYSVLVAFQCDTLHTDQNEIIGNSTLVGQFGMRYSNTGVLQAYLGTGTNGGTVQAGNTVVVAYTYRHADTTGTRHFYDSIRNLTSQSAAGPTNKSQGSLYLGSTTNVGRYIKGSIGEVKIYNAALSADDLQYQINLLNRKWIESRAVEPLDGGQAIAGTVELKWNNLLPDTQGDDVYVDVYFGTDPNRLTMTKVLNDGLNATAVIDGEVAAGNTYYWAVDTSFGYAAGDDDPNLIRGPFFSFTTVADPAPAAINVGPDYISWPNQGVPINAIVTDSGSADVTVTFTATDPNMVFSPNPVVIAGDGGVASTTATIDYTAPVVTVTASAEDAANPGLTVADTMTIQLYGSACQAARLGAGLASVYTADLVLGETSACKIDLEDFAALAAQWLVEYSATAAFPRP